MELNQRIDELESELKIVKNEVQAVLLDIRERVLSYYDNPFQAVVIKSPTRKEPETATVVTTNVAGEEPASKSPKRDGEDQSNGGSQTREAAATSQLKALMDRLEPEREALKGEEQVAQPAPAAQPEGASFQAVQAAAPPPGFGPAPSDYRPPERDRWQRPAETEREEGIKQEGRGTLRRSPRSSRLEEEGMGRPAQATDVERKQRQEQAPDSDQTEVNLLTLVGLARWAEKSTSKIGKERVEAVVDIYQRTGCLPASYKDVIPRIIRLADGEKLESQPTMGDSLNVLLQLDSLLGRKFKTQAAILSTLFGDDGGYPWTKQ
jgi:outer membrane murein-binding lipoprotein Lpp